MFYMIFLIIKKILFHKFEKKACIYYEPMTLVGGDLISPP